MPDLFPDFEPPAGGFERLLEKRERHASGVRAVGVLVPAAVLASCLLVIGISLQSRTPALNMSAIDAELYGRAISSDGENRYRAVEQASSRSDVQVYTIETEPRRN